MLGPHETSPSVITATMEQNRKEMLIVASITRRQPCTTATLTPQARHRRMDLSYVRLRSSGAGAFTPDRLEQAPGLLCYRSLWRRCYAVDALALLPDFILVLFLKCVQQAQCRSVIDDNNIGSSS